MRLSRLIIPAAAVLTASLQAQIPAAEFAARRDSLAARLDSGVVVAFGGRTLVNDFGTFFQLPAFHYLTNFDEPYLLWVHALLLAILGLILMSTRSRPWWIRRETPYGYSRLARVVQSPPAVVAFIVFSGLLQAVYWIRQGGDFMHGRVLLTPMFCLLAPVAVIPVPLPDGEKFSRGIGYQLAGISSVLWLAVVAWSLHSSRSRITSCSASVSFCSVSLNSSFTCRGSSLQPFRESPTCADVSPSGDTTTSCEPGSSSARSR